jgi:ABC-type transport system substrate-binding protein
MVGVHAGTENLDPAITTLSLSLFLAHQCLSSLVRLDPLTMDVMPDLAERWSASPDAKEWTFYLRKGVKFSNGKDFKAEDVKFTFDRVRDYATASAIFPFLEKAEVIDDYTVKITNSQPFAGFLAACADGKAHIVPKLSEEELKKIGGDYANTLIGTGPFIFKERKLGDFERIVRNPNYYIKDEEGVQLPYLDEVEQKVQIDDAARVMGLKTGAFDFITSVPKSEVATLQKEKNLELFAEKARNVYTFSGNPALPLWQDINFRLACHYGINKQEFVDTITFGYGSVARTWLPPYDPFRYEVPSMDYDPTKAKELLAKSVYKGEVLEMKVYKAGPMPEVAVLLQKQLSDLGIKTKIIEQELGFYIDDVIRKGNWVVSPEWNCCFSDPAITLNAHLHKKSGTYNWRHVGDDHLDSLLDAAARELDFNRRKEIYKEAQIYIMESSWWIPIVWDPLYCAYNKKVKGLIGIAAGNGWPEYWKAWIEK